MNIVTVPALGDNYAYLVICEQSGQAAAVDPADAEAIQHRLDREGAKLVAIWNTHHHLDHTAGNQDLLSGRSLKVYGHELDADRIPGLTHRVRDGERFKLGVLEVRVLHTPGHTRGSACFLVQDALFTGDTLFGAGCGRLSEGDAPTMYHSLHHVLRPLPERTRVYCGHEYTEKNLGFTLAVEPDNEAARSRLVRVRQERGKNNCSVPFTLDTELQTNPFLRCDSESIRRTLSERYPDETWDALGVFTRLRELRNRY